MNSERPWGLVKDFRICNFAYLDLICKDLKLNCTPYDLLFLQSLYKSEKRDPNVTELLFDIAYGKQMKTYPETNCVATVDFQSEDLFTLFSDFSAEFTQTDGAPNLCFSLYEAFLQKFQPNIPADAGVFHLISATCPIFPQNGADAIVAKTQDYLLTYAEKKAPNVKGSAEVGILFLPMQGCPTDTFLQAGFRFISKVRERFPYVQILPCSSKSLIEDAFSVQSQIDFFCGSVPGKENEPDTCLLAMNPGFWILSPNASAIPIRSMAAPYPFLHDVPVYFRDIANNCHIYSAAEPIWLTDAFRNGMFVKNVSNVCPNPKEYGKTQSIPTEGIQAADVEAFTVGENIYDALDALYRPDCAYGFALKMNPAADDTIPLLLALDAFRRNRKPKIAASVCEISEENRLTLFRIHNSEQSYPDFNKS